MSEILLEWLETFAKCNGPVCSPRKVTRRQFEVTRAGVEMEQWPRNALKYSFASYHLAVCQNAPALDLEAGHSYTDIIFRHYRSLVRPDVAERYWNIFTSP